MTFSNTTFFVAELISLCYDSLRTTTLLVNLHIGLHLQNPRRRYEDFYSNKTDSLDFPDPFLYTFNWTSQKCESRLARFDRN